MAARLRINYKEGKWLLIIVLGLDISTKTGYCVLADEDIIAYGVIKLKSKELQERCKELAGEIQELEFMYKPDIAILESAFVGPNPSTTALLNKLQGAVIKTLSCPIRNIVARSARKLVMGKDTGKQGAFDYVVSRYNLLDLVYKKDNDITDATILALTGFLGE